MQKMSKLEKREREKKEKLLVRRVTVMALVLIGKLIQKRQKTPENIFFKGEKEEEEKRHYGRKESKCNGFGANLLAK